MTTTAPHVTNSYYEDPSDDNRRAVRKIAEALIPNLQDLTGKDYSIKTTNYSNGKTELNAEGMCLTIELEIRGGKNDGKRLIISGDIGNLSEHMHSGRDGNEIPSIFVAREREPAAIAREIARRLIPAYENLMRVLLSRRQEALLKNSEILEIGERLRRASRGQLRVEEVKDGPDRVVIYQLNLRDNLKYVSTSTGYSIEGYCCGGDVVLQRARLSVDDFEAILQLLAERHKDALVKD